MSNQKKKLSNLHRKVNKQQEKYRYLQSQASTAVKMWNLLGGRIELEAERIYGLADIQGVTPKANMVQRMLFKLWRATKPAFFEDLKEKVVLIRVATVAMGGFKGTPQDFAAKLGISIEEADTAIAEMNKLIKMAQKNPSEKRTQKEGEESRSSEGPLSEVQKGDTQGGGSMIEETTRSAAQALAAVNANKESYLRGATHKGIESVIPDGPMLAQEQKAEGPLNINQQTTQEVKP